jgi:hypothetical protein
MNRRRRGRGEGSDLSPEGRHLYVQESGFIRFQDAARRVLFRAP